MKLSSFLLLLLRTSIIIFITVCLGVDFLVLIFWGKSLYFLDLDICFLPQIREFLSYYIFKYIFAPFCLSSSSEMPIMGMLLCLMESLSSLRQYSILNIFFFSFAQPGYFL